MGDMRHVIIGAGAVGGTIGGRLFEGGHEVVLVARGPHLDALRAHGLRLATPDGVVALPVAAVGQPGELDLRDGDVLVLAVKTQDAEAVLAEWAWRPVRGGTVAAESLPVVCAQNGVASERIALRRFRHVYGMCVWLPATHLEPGTVEAQGAPLAGMLHIGRYPSGTDAMATQIGADLAQSRFLAPVSADVMRWKYGKLLGNSATRSRRYAGTTRGTTRLTCAGGRRPKGPRCLTRLALPTRASRRARTSVATGCGSNRSTVRPEVAARPGKA